MSLLALSPGNTIRHIKRGTRYRVTASFRCRASRIADGDRYWLLVGAASDPCCEVVPADRTGAARMNDRGLDVSFSARLSFHAQIDDRTRGAAISAGDEEIEFLLYDGLDHAGQRFARPTSEFSDDRFTLVPVASPLEWRLAAMLPSQLEQIVQEHDAVSSGAATAGTLLRDLARDTASDLQDASASLPAIMASLACGARDLLGGDGRGLAITLSATERTAVEDLGGVQGLSAQEVVRQAIRLYQSHQKGHRDTPPFGCMGD